jgi:hypothetical protein
MINCPVIRFETIATRSEISLIRMLKYFPKENKDDQKRQNAG